MKGELTIKEPSRRKLRRTIVQMDEIEQARVHLVLPEKSVFIKEERPASAAVTIALKPLAQLSPEQNGGLSILFLPVWKICRRKT